jgi:hypothetical protein
MTSLRWLAVIALGTGTALAAGPEPTQFAQGIDLAVQSDRPLVEVMLPDEVYRTIRRADLADVGVFDREDRLVPHAICVAPENAPATVSTIDLPVTELQSAAAAASGTQVDVQTSSGTKVEVRDPARAEPAIRTSAHVIDATAVENELRAIEFEWQTIDGSSEARVRIEGSDDLDRWNEVVGATTLLNAGTGEQQLRRGRVPLPQRRYRYLRVERMDGGQPLSIQSARAEQVAAASTVEPQWFAAREMEGDADGRVFTTDRQAPVQYARVKLPRDNMTVRITLQSRRDAKSPWQTHWSGEMYAITSAGERRVSPPAKFPMTNDREWRLQAPRGGAEVELELGYRPALLRFLKQGSGPFTLAYGSGQVDASSAVGCNQLLSDVAPKDLRALIGEASLGPSHLLGGDDAFKPVPKKTPTRLIVLWSVLIVGVALLVTMALSLLKRVRPTE